MILVLKFMLELSLLSILVCCCFGQSGGMIALTNIETDDQTAAPEVLSRNDLKSVYGVAKSMSYSKGTIIKSKKGEFEYRRSFTSKVELEVHSLQLKSVIIDIQKNVFQNSFNKSLILENLDFLENLVHQYEIGKKFVDIAGFQIILSLTQHKDDDISKAAFITLSAAMQGNQRVQLYATKTDLLKFITDTLSSDLMNRTNSALLTLSAFVRNCPDALNTFIEKQGLELLSILFNNNSSPKIQMKIVDMLRDITSEIYDENPDTSKNELERIKKNFTRDIELYSICDKIVEFFFASNEYKSHEKIVAAMVTMFKICKVKFKTVNMNKKLEALMELYNPFKTLKLWYEPLADIELRYYLFQDLKELLMKLTSDSAHIKNDSIKYKTEL